MSNYQPPNQPPYGQQPPPGYGQIQPVPPNFGPPPYGYPQPYGGPPRPPATNRWPWWAIIAGCLLTVFGAVLPWLSAAVNAGIYSQSVTVTGLEGDGVLTLLAALIIGFLAALTAIGGLIDKASAIIALVLSVGILGVAAYDIINIESGVADLAESEGIAVSGGAGSGLYLTMLSGVILTGVSIWAIAASQQKKQVWMPMAPPAYYR